MFKRINDLFIVSTNNLRALEAISEFVYLRLHTTYLIQIELFRNETIYNIYIPITNYDERCLQKEIAHYLDMRHVKLMTVIET